MRLSRATLLLALGLALLCPPPGRLRSQPPPAPPAPQPSQGMDPAQLRQRLNEVQSRLGQVDQQLESLKRRRKGVLVELQGITLQAERARAQAEGARLRRDQAKAEVDTLGARQEALRQDIQRLRGQIRKQVRWMQALGPLGEWSFLPALTDLDQLLTQERYLTWWRNQQRRRLLQVQRLQGDLEARGRELQAALVRLEQEERDAGQLQASLRLGEERLQTFLEGIASDESRQKQVQNELAEEALQLERMLSGLLGKPRSDAFAPSAAFAGLRGELPQPVRGTLALGFGEQRHPRFKTRTMSSGLLLAADNGAPVSAVADGKVVFADVYQSYGSMVILDHGGGWFTLYTHLQGMGVAKGQVIHQGEQLGSVGETLDGPRLGFEVRYMSQPQDPNKWLKSRYK